MSEDTTRAAKRLLDPMERISEILFGLIMVLTFTCSFSVAGAGRTEVREMLLAALGCNLAWGIVDAVFYLMSCLSEQGHGIIADALPPLLAAVLPESEFEVMRRKLAQLPEPPSHPRIAKDEWLAAGVCSCGFPFPPSQW